MRHWIISRLLQRAAAAAAESRGGGAAGGPIIRAGTCSCCKILRLFTNSSQAEAAYFSDQGSKSPSGRDTMVSELDEQGQKVGTSGPDPSRPKNSIIWYQQTVEGAMSNDSATPPGPGGPDEGRDRHSPGGPTAEDLDHLRPTGQGGGSNSLGTGGPGAYVTERLKEAAAGAWETLKHGVNNPGQPQVMEELKQTSPQDAEVLTNPRGATAAVRQQRDRKLEGEGRESSGKVTGGGGSSGSEGGL